MACSGHVNYTVVIGGLPSMFGKNANRQTNNRANAVDIIERNVFIQMERDNLRGIPDYPLPPGYCFHWYEPGDEQMWVDIHVRAENHAEVSHGVYVREFGRDVEALHQRQCFLLVGDGAPVGTATAWFNDDYHGRRYGRVHWVAVVPEYQGRGLSKPLLSTVLSRMVDLGHERAYLRTSTARLPAINLYAQFGFAPSLRTPQDRAVWQDLTRAAGHRILEPLRRLFV
jgi:GNAT superfamily N-acetyltransferase